MPKLKKSNVPVVAFNNTPPSMPKIYVYLVKNGKGKFDPKYQFRKLNRYCMKYTTYGGARFNDHKSCYYNSSSPYFEVVFMNVDDKLVHLSEEEIRKTVDKKFSVIVRKADIFIVAFCCKEIYYEFKEEGSIFNFKKSYLFSRYKVEFPDIGAKILSDIIDYLSGFSMGPSRVAQGYLHFVIWIVAEACRFESIFTQIYECFEAGWLHVVKKLQTDLYIVNEWTTCAFKMIDLYHSLSPNDNFDLHSTIVETTGVKSYDQLNQSLRVLPMEDETRIEKRLGDAYKGKVNPMLFAMPIVKSTRKSESDILEYWRNRPNDVIVKEDMWKSFERFSSIVRDKRFQIARALLYKIGVVKVQNETGAPYGYKLTYVHTDCTVGVMTVPNFLFTSRQVPQDESDDDELDFDTFKKFRLISKTIISPTLAKFRFALHSLTTHASALGVIVGQSIICRGMDCRGEEVTRPYTPITLNDVGYFEFVIKMYENGRMSHHFQHMKEGDSISMKASMVRFKYVAKPGLSFGMLCEGWGIAPVFQLVRAYLENPDFTGNVHLIYANVTHEDIVFKEELDVLKNNHHGRFTIYYVLQQPPPGWTGGIGDISKDMIQKCFTRPGESKLQIIIGGPPENAAVMTAHCDALGYNQPLVF